MVTYPSDWSTFSFDEMFQLYPNNTLSRDKLSEHGEIGNIHYGDVLIKYGAVLSAKDSIPKIKTEYESGVRAFLQQNDIIVADTAEDETVGKVVQIGEIPFPLVGGLHTIVCRPLVPTATGYLGYYMNSKEYHDQLLPYITGIKVSSLSKTSIRKTELHVPSTVKEQAAIVNAIGSFDTHIVNLAELIYKKKAIRDGALEGLLSGRIRLAGFDDEWVVKPLETICKVYDGTHQTPKYVPNGIRFVSVENIGDIYASDKYISEAAYGSDFKAYPEKGDILMTRIGDIGTPCIVSSNEPIAYYVSLALLKEITIHTPFLYYAMQGEFFQKELDDRTLHHATPKKINKGEIGKCLVKYPNSQDEQETIADVLTAMDDEIRGLESERDKMIQIREGAMDDLLTGRVRLAV